MTDRFAAGRFLVYWKAEKNPFATRERAPKAENKETTEGAFQALYF